MISCHKMITSAGFPRYYHPCRRHSLPSLLIKRPATTALPPTPTKAPPRAAATSHSAALQSLSPPQREQISLYVHTLLQWNQRMNLTAASEESEVMTRHVEDSLAIVPALERCYLSRCAGASSSLERLSLVDVGSGAGLPGLVLAIAYPSWKVSLIESMRKRCLFLKHIVGLIGLSNVQVLCERAELFAILQCIQVFLGFYPQAGSEKGFIDAQNVGQSIDFREKFDVVVARAVAEMRVLAEYCLPLVRVGGLFIAAKGYNPQEEIKSAENAIRLMGASVLEFCSVESHAPLGKRTAVICLKDRATPRKYPRHLGIPSKNPL